MPVTCLRTPGISRSSCCTHRSVTICPLTTAQHAEPSEPFGVSKVVLKRQQGGCRGRRSIAVKPVCASPIQQLQQIFSSGSPAKTASKEIQALIQEGSEDVERFRELVDVLLDSELPFKESSLDGGEWQVVYTRGAPLWQQLTSPGQVKSAGRLSYKSKSKAGQDFSASGRVVKNRGELLGGSVVVTAEGTYEPQDSETNLPKLIKANISSGEMVAWGRRIPLPISGSAFVSIMYVDDTVRVLSNRKTGTVSVQVQADRLRQLVA